jgi:hypothetical protein
MCVCSYTNTHMGVLIQTHPTTTPYCTLLQPTTPLLTAPYYTLHHLSSLLPSFPCLPPPPPPPPPPQAHAAIGLFYLPTPFQPRAFWGSAHEMHPPSLRNALATSLSCAPHPQAPQREQREGARGRRGGGHTRDQVRGLAEEVRWSINCGAVASGLFGTCPRRTVYLFTAFSLV